MNNMQVISAQYIEVTYNGATFVDSIRATIDGINMSVPLDPANRHYAAILKAVEEGTLVIQEATA